MLEGLDSINWSELGHAFGSAEDVPENLRGLCSVDCDVRSNAIGDLFGTVWHQGTVYSASPFVIPFLVELLDAPGIAGKELIATLLACIASGTGYYQVHGEFVGRQSKNPEDIEAAVAVEGGIVRAVRQAASPHIFLLLGYLKHREPAVREAVTKALPLYPEHFSSSKLALEYAYSVETDEDALREIKDALDTIRKTA